MNNGVQGLLKGGVFCTNPQQQNRWFLSDLREAEDLWNLLVFSKNSGPNAAKLTSLFDSPDGFIKNKAGKEEENR